MRQLLYGKKGNFEGWFAVTADDRLEYVPSSQERFSSLALRSIQDTIEGKPFKAISIVYASEQSTYYTCSGVRMVLIKVEEPPVDESRPPSGWYYDTSRHTVDWFARPPFHRPGETCPTGSVTDILFRKDGYVRAVRTEDGRDFLFLRDPDSKADTDKYFVKAYSVDLRMNILVRAVDVSCFDFEVVA